MKRRTLKSIACAAAIALALSVTACGGSKDSANDADTTEVEKTVDTAESEEANNDEAEVNDEAAVEEEAGAAGEYASLEEAFSDPTLKKMFEDELGLDDMQEEGMSISYEVSGNEFIYTFQFTDDSVVLSDEITEYLSTALNAQAAVFEEAAAELDDALGQEGACSVTVRYLAANEDVLYENTYSAK